MGTAAETGSIEIMEELGKLKCLVVSRALTIDLDRYHQRSQDPGVRDSMAAERAGISSCVSNQD